VDVLTLLAGLVAFIGPIFVVAASNFRAADKHARDLSGRGSIDEIGPPLPRRIIIRGQQARDSVFDLSRLTPNQVRTLLIVLPQSVSRAQDEDQTYILNLSNLAPSETNAVMRLLRALTSSAI
jgi:hypothetical protein